MATKEKKKLTYSEHIAKIKEHGNEIQNVPVSMVTREMVELARKKYANVAFIPEKFTTFAMFISDAPSYSEKDARDFAETHGIADRFGISKTAFAKLVVKNEIPNMKKVPEKLFKHVEFASYRLALKGNPAIASTTPEYILNRLAETQKDFILRVYSNAHSNTKYSSYWTGYKMLKLFKQEHFSDETIKSIVKDLEDRFKHNRSRPNLHEVPDFLITLDMCKNIVEKSGTELAFVPEELKTLEICQAAVNNDGKAIRYVPKDLKDSFYTDAAKAGGLGSIPKEDRTERLCSLAVESDAKQISQVPEEFISYGLCLTAVDGHAGLIKNVPSKFRDKEMVVRMLVSMLKKNYDDYDFRNRIELEKGEKPALETAFDSVITSRSYFDIQEEKHELISEAIKRYPKGFSHLVELSKNKQWAPISEMIDFEMCITAFKSDEENIHHIPTKYLIQVFKGYLNK